MDEGLRPEHPVKKKTSAKQLAWVRDAHAASKGAEEIILLQLIGEAAAINCTLKQLREIHRKGE